MSRTFLLLGAINVMLGVALGALGAHGLKHMLTPDLLTIFHTGVQYHFYHAFGLLIIGILLLHFPQSRWMAISGWLMLLGIVLFSCSLYVLTLTGNRSLAMITPFGGISFLSAWGVLIYALWKGR